MWEVLAETFVDTVKTVPYLYLIYLLLEWLQRRAGHRRVDPQRLDRMGPVLGAAVGCVPQCGFSAAAAALYGERIIRGGTLIAVSLATSDEAVPVLLSTPGGAMTVLAVLGVKFVVGIAAGYLLNGTVFCREGLAVREERVEMEFHSCEAHEHHEGHGSVWLHALYHTLKITATILVSMAVINLCIHWLGEERFSALLLSGSAFQPLVAGLIGLIPGCSISVLITQLLVGGQISFGAAIAGLCTGAGFGYVVLARKVELRRLFKIVGCTYVCAVAAGFLIDWIGRLL